MQWKWAKKRLYTRHLLNVAQKLSVHTSKFCGPSRKDPPQMYPSSQKSVTIAITSGSWSFSSSSLTCLSSSFTGANDTELGSTVLENALPKKGKRLSQLFGLWVFNGCRVFTDGARMFADGTLVSTDFGVSEEVDGSCCIAVSEWRWYWGFVAALWWSVPVWSRLSLADELGLSLSCSNARLKRKVIGYYRFSLSDVSSASPERKATSAFILEQGWPSGGNTWSPSTNVAWVWF